MKKLILLFILIITTTCFAQEKTPAIQQFSLNINKEKAQNICTLEQNGTWTKLNENTYECKAEVNQKPLVVTLFVKNDIVQKVTVETTNKNICDIMKARVKEISCFDEGSYWGYCSKNWKMNCTHVTEKNVNVIDLMKR